MLFYIQQITKLRKYLLSISLFIFLSYCGYLIFDVNTICLLGKEDGAFEYLTAVFFLIASVSFFRSFLIKRNIFFLLLSIVFFIGFGEEISWGQRILNFDTPAPLSKINVQNEFNLHNIITFNGVDFNHSPKSGWNKLLTINFLYKLFWLAYCVLLPIACMHIRFVSSLAGRIRLPVPPIAIGLFFLINWFVFRIILSFLLPSNLVVQYYWAIGEIRECVSAFIFMMISFYFLKEQIADSGALYQPVKKLEAH